MHISLQPAAYLILHGHLKGYTYHLFQKEINITYLVFDYTCTTYHTLTDIWIIYTLHLAMSASRASLFSP